MLPQRLDMLIAFKAISLTPDLSVTERRVASAIIDHFNKRTTQCDPSIDTLAALLGIDRRTVIRSVNRLVSLKYFRRIRHGGNFHRNFYEPNWKRFREVEAAALNIANGFAGRNCHLRRGSLNAVLVARLSPKPVLAICLTKLLAT
jgi:DNA-binding MarR family transcriptional regulator